MLEVKVDKNWNWAPPALASSTAQSVSAVGQTAQGCFRHRLLEIAEQEEKKNTQWNDHIGYYTMSNHSCSESGSNQPLLSSVFLPVQ